MWNFFRRKPAPVFPPHVHIGAWIELLPPSNALARLYDDGRNGEDGLTWSAPMTSMIGLRGKIVELTFKDASVYVEFTVPAGTRLCIKDDDEEDWRQEARHLRAWVYAESCGDPDVCALEREAKASRP